MKTAYILGNGDSMLDFDYASIADDCAIVINDGYRKKPHAAFMLFADESFYALHRDGNAADDFWRFKGDLYSDCAMVSDHPRIKWLDEKLLTVKAGKKKFCAVGKNTGIKAICFALNMGFERVALLGFDGRPNANNYPAQDVYDKYAEHHKELAALGLPIVNMTPNSALTMYQTVLE